MDARGCVQGARSVTRITAASRAGCPPTALASREALRAVAGARGEPQFRSSSALTRSAGRQDRPGAEGARPNGGRHVSAGPPGPGTAPRLAL